MPSFNIPQQSRSGEFTAVSANLTNKFDFCNVNLNINPIDYIDETKSITLTVQVADIPANEWNEVFSFTWTGGAKVGKDGSSNPQPSLGFGLDQYEGKRARVVIKIPNPLRVGASVILQ